MAFGTNRILRGGGNVVSTIITVATMKGGSGKSTVASSLAVHWHLRGRRPTLLDADPQRSIMRLVSRERALGGVAVVEDATDEAANTARRILAGRPQDPRSATQQTAGTSAQRS